MYLVIGLGNPGKEYQITRHNFGSMVLQSLVDDLGLQWEKHKTGNKVAIAKFGTATVVLALPKTFMNESGLTVKELAKFYKIQPANIILIYDDIDLEFERIKVSQNKTAGGHNGVQSVIDQLGSPDFARIRLGINPQKGPAEKFVLEKFSIAQQKQLPEILDRAKAALDTLVREGLEKTANEFN